MPTVEFVAIGVSGVGKTSLRGQYISGRFPNGYRANMVADFITKTLPHPSNPGDMVTLQTWDTVGQERFSSLSTAFFRAAHAEFRERAPLADEDVEDYCCVVVGNKTALVKSRGTGRNENGKVLRQGEGPITEEDFLRELVPLTSRSPSLVYTCPLPDEEDADAGEEGRPVSSQITVRTASLPQTPQSTPPQTRSDSITITPNHNTSRTARSPLPLPSYSRKHCFFKSRSRSASRFYGGTMTTTHTTLTIYYTPSSLFDVDRSTRSSPEPWSSPSSVSASNSSSSPSARMNTSVRICRLITLSNGSPATITPASLHANTKTNTYTNTSPRPPPPPPLSSKTLPPPSPLRRSQTQPRPIPTPLLDPAPTSACHRAQAFFTSARTGAGISEVFVYILRGAW